MYMYMYMYKKIPNSAFEKYAERVEEWDRGPAAALLRGRQKDWPKVVLVAESHESVTYAGTRSVPLPTAVLYRLSPGDALHRK